MLSYYEYIGCYTTMNHKNISKQTIDITQETPIPSLGHTQICYKLNYILVATLFSQLI